MTAMHRVTKTADGKNFGESHHKAKLTTEDVQLMRALYADGMSYSEIFRKWEDVSIWTIISICRRRSRIYE